MPAVLPGHGSLSRACLSPSSSSQGSLHFFPAKLLFVEGSQCAQRLPRGPASCLAALHGGRSSGPASPSQQWRPSLVNGSLVSQPRPASPHHSPTPPDSPGFTANLSTQTPQPTPAWRGEGGASHHPAPWPCAPTTTTQPACKQRREGPPGDLQELCQEKRGRARTHSVAETRRFIFKETAGTGSCPRCYKPYKMIGSL